MVVSMLSLGWGRVKEASKAATYWDSYVAFVDMMMLPCVMKAVENSDVGSTFIKVGNHTYSVELQSLVERVIEAHRLVKPSDACNLN